MSLLRTIEESIARLVEGSFGKVFRTSVQPVELARRLVKEMDEHQQRTVRNVYVPNRYDVFLSRDDHRKLAPFAAALNSELSEYLAEHARRNAYALLTRPRVQLNLDRDLPVGRFGISVRMEQTDELDAEIADDAAAERAAPTPSAPPAPITPIRPITPLGSIPPIPLTEAAARPHIAGPSPEAAIAASNALNDDPSGPPRPAATPATVGIFGNGAPFPLAAGAERLRVGRGRANDIVLQDASVSREHGEFVQRDGSWFVRDLDSTNGVAINGSKVSDARLEVGDRVLFGSVEVRFDHWRDGQD